MGETSVVEGPGTTAAMEVVHAFVGEQSVAEGPGAVAAMEVVGPGAAAAMEVVVPTGATGLTWPTGPTEPTVLPTMVAANSLVVTQEVEEMAKAAAVALSGNRCSTRKAKQSRNGELRFRWRYSHPCKLRHPP